MERMKKSEQNIGERVGRRPFAPVASEIQQNNANAASEEDERENEGRFMELEKRLWERTEQGVRKKPRPCQRPSRRSRKSELGNHDDNTERVADYENNQATRLQQQRSGYGESNAFGQAEAQSGHQAQGGQGGASHGPDLQDGGPGNSGHQAGKRRRSSVLPVRISKGTVDDIT